MGSGGQNESKCQKLDGIGEKEIFHEHDVSNRTLDESNNQTFLGSGGQNESKCQKLAPIDKKKIIHEFDVHHV